MVLCFVLLLSSIHYMYDYIKNEFTETREVPTSNDYTKNDIYNNETSNEIPKKEKREKQIKREKPIEKDQKLEKIQENDSENISTEDDYTPICQLKKPIEENVDNSVSSIPITTSAEHKKETNELDDYFKSLH